MLLPEILCIQTDKCSLYGVLHIELSSSGPHLGQMKLSLNASAPAAQLGSKVDNPPMELRPDRKGPAGDSCVFRILYSCSSKCCLTFFSANLFPTAWTAVKPLRLQAQKHLAYRCLHSFKGEGWIETSPIQPFLV